MTLRAEIIVTDPRVHESERLPVRVTIVNDSGNDLVVNSRLLVNGPNSPHEITFDIKRGQESLRFIPRIRVRPHSNEFTVLKSGESIGRTVNLARYYRLTKGEYSVRATYTNKDQPAPETGYARAWMGNVPSNESTFEVVSMHLDR